MGISGRRMGILVAAAVASLALLPATLALADKDKQEDALKGALIGAGVGALVGDGKGAAAGAVVGAIIGANKK